MKYINKIALVLVIILFIIAGFHIYKTNFRGESSQSYQDDQNKLYEEYLQKQNQAYNDYLNKLDGQLERSIRLNDKVVEHQQRYDKILSRWEKQADRMDAILLKLEK